MLLSSDHNWWTLNILYGSCTWSLVNVIHYTWTEGGRRHPGWLKAHLTWLKAHQPGWRPTGQRAHGKAERPPWGSRRPMGMRMVEGPNAKNLFWRNKITIFVSLRYLLNISFLNIAWSDHAPKPEMPKEGVLRATQPGLLYDKIIPAKGWNT